MLAVLVRFLADQDGIFRQFDNFAVPDLSSHSAWRFAGVAGRRHLALERQRFQKTFGDVTRSKCLQNHADRECGAGGIVCLSPCVVEYLVL